MRAADVKGKFVVVHLTPRSYADGSEQRSRETAALQNGAKGILLVGQPLSNLPARWPTKDGFYVAKVTDKAAKELLTKKQMEANVAIDLSTEHTSNVVAKIEAPKANNPEGDVLILGAHYDHMGIEEYEGEPAIFHGADDNASGTAGILELARYISDRRDFLKKDVIVILFGAEERGLKGSRYYAANPVEPLDNVKAMVNIDMMGRMPAEKTLGIRGLGPLTKHLPCSPRSPTTTTSNWYGSSVKKVRPTTPRSMTRASPPFRSARPTTSIIINLPTPKSA
ncbi:MAG: M28 family metallopeptidase [Alistipes indistinctus]